MKVRQDIFDIYWKFAAGRQEIFFNRIKNSPPPWTEDEVLKEYKFCNAYRASDRVSQYLIKKVIYQGSQNEEEVSFRILLFKIFNKIETWQYLESKLGSIEISNFDFDVYAGLLQSAMDAGQAIYTSAYMSCAKKEYGYDKKHENHLVLIGKMVKEDCLVKKIVNAKNMGEVFNCLIEYPLIGKFMAYQLAIDLNYSEIIDFSENSFTMAGPGAERGIEKCFIDRGGKSNAEIIFWMVENQAKEFDRLGINFPSLWGRPLQAIDCQNLFCEVDKYCRVAVPELKSDRKKIKSKFSATSQIIEYFYPPKWGINDKVKETLAQRLPSVEAPVVLEYEDKKKRGRKPKFQSEDNGDLQLSLDYQINEDCLTGEREIKDKNKRGRKPKSQQPEDESFTQLCLF